MGGAKANEAEPRWTLCLSWIVGALLSGCIQGAGSGNSDSRPEDGTAGAGGTNSGRSPGSPGAGPDPARADAGVGGDSATGGDDGGGGIVADVEPTPFITPEPEPAEDPPLIIDEGCLDVAAELDETLLVVLLDVGESMGSNRAPTASRVLKWEPVKAGLDSFFTSTAGVGTRAALTFFPKPATSNAMDAGVAISCDQSDYASFDLPFTSLPTDVLGDAIDTSVPEGDEGWLPDTPTLAALEGSYGATLAALEDGPVRRATVILITDGRPEGCSAGANDIATIVESVARVSEVIQTAVVAIESPVADQLSEPADISVLAELAEAGGFGDSHRIDASNATATAEALEATLHDLREQATRCEITVPEPPAGAVFDPDRLNVHLFGSLDEIPLAYDAACESDQAAWRFDDVEAPQKVVLCPEACATHAPSLYEGSLELRLLFGCPRREVAP